MVCYDPQHDLMYCSCGNTDRLDGFHSLNDISDLGRFRLFILDWLVRLGVVPVGVASPVFTCVCGAVYCITPGELRIAENFQRKLEHAWGAASWAMQNKSKAQLDRAHPKVRDILSFPSKK